ncbi:MAG: sulfur carrier protein ThiS [Coxiella endosymbiont of Haemaphysalis qinghaiensis]
MIEPFSHSPPRDGISKEGQVLDICLNGEALVVSPRTTLKKLLVDKDFSGFFVVAINELVINPVHYEKTILQPGDRIEVITAMCGG